MARVFSGIQPTGQPHLGNLLGAIRHWVTDQDQHDCLYCIVDLHSITLPYEPDELRRSTLELATVLLACGIDPHRSVLFVQSHVAAHAELAWILNAVATMGELGRMTQFKSKSGGRDSVSAGLFDYPVLMAADVLVYQGERVPVGDDQRQHLELMRDIATRFNHRFGATFAVPEAAIPRVGARIMDLQMPDAKMSKTGGTELGTVWVLDPPARLKRKIMSAVTDSESVVRAGPDKAGVTALLEILSAVTDTPIATLEDRYAGSGYGAFKRDVLDALVAYLEPLQARYNQLANDPGEVHRLLAVGAQQARDRAAPTLVRAKQAAGFLVAADAAP
jgi:tryptophanyl-tRNA synthetase